MRTVGLYTLGCKVSQYETEAIAESFEALGFTVLPFSERCDAYVINTCTVTRESDRKCRQVIRRAIAENSNAVVAVLGCYSQRAPGEISSIAGVDIVLGTEGKMRTAELVLSALTGGGELPFCSVGDLAGAKFEPMTVKRAQRTRAYVKIEDGCECRCSYCAIAAARGPVRSKPKDEVIREVEALSALGTHEIVLTGIETGSYGRDLGGEYDLGDLILELDRRHSCKRIRLGSMAPELVGAAFAEKVSRTEIFAPHLHMSLQSGSTRILGAMRRRYTRALAVENMLRLREMIPEIQFTSDLMVGFPGESDEDFAETESLLREMKLLGAHVFAYSKREGTPAANYPLQVPESVKRERSRALIKASVEVRRDILAGLLSEGGAHSVILEDFEDGCYNAHSASFVPFRVKAEEGRQGEAVTVVPVSNTDDFLVGKII